MPLPRPEYTDGSCITRERWLTITPRHRRLHRPAPKRRCPCVYGPSSGRWVSGAGGRNEKIQSTREANDVEHSGRGRHSLTVVSVKSCLFYQATAAARGRRRRCSCTDRTLVVVAILQASHRLGSAQPPGRHFHWGLLRPSGAERPPPRPAFPLWRRLVPPFAGCSLCRRGRRTGGAAVDRRSIA